MPVLSFQSRVFVLVLAMLTLFALAAMAFTDLQLRAAVEQAENRGASNTLNLVTLDLSGRYDGLLRDKIDTLHARRQQLDATSDILFGAIGALDALDDNETARSRIQAAILDYVGRLQLGGGRFAFVYDSNLTILSHTDPAWIGQQIGAARDFKGRPLAAALLAETRQLGRSFATYRWPRLSGAGTDVKFGLFRYIRKFDWVLVVADEVHDIEQVVRERRDQIVASLTETFSRLSIARSGFVFMFDGEGQVVVPPPSHASELLNEADRRTGQPLTVALRKQLEPGQVETTDFIPARSPKDMWEARVSYFKALDWYVAVIVPSKDLTEPARRVVREQAIAAAGLLVLGLALAYWFAGRLVRPLVTLAGYARTVPQIDFSEVERPTGAVSAIAARHPDEIGKLAGALIYMEHKLRDNVRILMDETAARLRISGELKVARDIQHGLLPDVAVELEGDQRADVVMQVIPAKEVGGDLCDVFKIDEHHVCLAVGDVSGKGVPAAFMMAVAKTLLRVSAERLKEPNGILAAVNDGLARNNPNMMFVTMFVAILDLRSGGIVYGNAGHPAPVVVASGRFPRRIEGRSGPACGVIGGFQYQGFADRLAQGETLVVFTDGVTDAAKPNGVLLGEPATIATLAGGADQATAAMIEKLIAHIEHFAEGAQQADDITVLAARAVPKETRGHSRPSPDRAMNTDEEQFDAASM